MDAVDFRSDTLTRPTPPMLDAMMRAEVGDDVWGEDPSVRALEEEAAARLGQAAGVFCPSGTMTNQIALQVHLRPGDEVICAPEAHIYNYEGGGIAANAGASVRFARSDRGRFSPEDAEAQIQSDDPHNPRTRLIAVEDTCNRGGGSVWSAAELDRLRDLGRDRGIPLHLDGARVFNRLVATGEDPAAYGKRFDSISVCLSKGLGAPVGSVLLGSASFIHEARRVRKRLGGGMRQAGYLAAAGRYALAHHVKRLADDHRRARTLGSALERCSAVQSVAPVETNIVIATLNPTVDAERFVKALKQRGVLAAGMEDRVRFVTHLDVSDDGIAHAAQQIEGLDLAA